jgi:hypothetical protein
MLNNMVPILLALFALVTPAAEPPAQESTVAPPPNFFITVKNSDAAYSCDYAVRGSIVVSSGALTQTVHSAAVTVAGGSGISLGFAVPTGYSYVADSESFKVKAVACPTGFIAPYVPIEINYNGNCIDCDGPNQVTRWINLGIVGGVRTYMLQPDVIPG